MNLKNYIKKTISIVVVVLCVLFFIHNLPEIIKLIEIDVKILVVFSFLVLTTQLLNGFRLRLLTKALELDLSFKDSLGLALLQSFLNYFPVKGGMALNAIYLKKLHNFPFKRFIAMASFSCIITTTTSGVIGLIVFGTVLIWDEAHILFLLFLFFAVVPLFISTIFVWLKRENLLPTIIFKSIVAEWEIMGQKKTISIILFITDAINIFVFSLRYYIAFLAFSKELPFLFCTVMACTAILSTFISFTPASIGIREGAIGFTSKIIGTGLNSGMYIAILDRAVEMFWILLLGPLAGLWLARNKK
jgi:uncharacterized protein (TIRG00374 family)